MPAVPPLDLDPPPLPTGDRSTPIGVIGAGFIVADVQLPAYRDAGFDVRAIASRSPARAEAAARAHRIPQVHQHWRDLLDDESVTVLDVAFPPDGQVEIIEEAAKRPHIRGILAQKPLAGSLQDAARAVAACEGGPLLAVNQNMRFDPAMRLVKAMLDRGDLGEPVLATIEMRAIPHWQTFLEGTDRLTLANMSIHHLDAFRYLLGDPEGIFVSGRPDPRTRFAHRDGIVLSTLEWADGRRASAWDDVWSGPVREGSEGDGYIRWRVEGTEGLAWGEFGWPDWPTLKPTTFHVATSARPGAVIERRFAQTWFPDAFAGTMGDLLGALAGGELSISGEDNLRTMALVEAGYRSMEEHRLVRVDEVLAELPAHPTRPLTAAGDH